MSHVDEGRLSEYLDRPDDGSADRGEIERHLAECAGCRARLEEVRAVRDRAAELLRAAAPANVAMPQFAEIQARARARQAPRRVLTMRRLTALGWAATIVIAAGVGWLARGSFGLGGSGADRLSDQATATAAAPAEAAVPDSSARGDVAGAVREGAVVLSQEAPPPQAEAIERDAAPGVAYARAPSRAAAPVAEPQRVEPQAPAAANLAEREQPAAKAEPIADVRTRQAVAGVVVLADERGDAAGRGAMPVDSAANELARLADEALVTTSWTGATAQEAERHLGRPLGMVGGLPVEDIRTGEVGGQPAAVVTQVLPGGEQLEIVQWRTDDVGAPVLEQRLAEGARRAQAPAPTDAAGRTDVVIARDGVMLVVRAPLPADSLSVLVGRVR